MAKKEKPPLDSAPLKHSPFASLRGALARTETAHVDAAQPSPAPQITQREPAAPAPRQPQDAAPAAGGKSRGRLVLRRETKHRAGKAVIVVTGFEQLKDFDDVAQAALAKELKQALGCGGTLETSAGRPELVLQGDRPAQVAALLRARGFRVAGVTE
jgi:translation initiation factor 1 (eIF-1/SUI1)